MLKTFINAHFQTQHGIHTWGLDCCCWCRPLLLATITAVGVGTEYAVLGIISLPSCSASYAGSEEKHRENCTDFSILTILFSKRLLDLLIVLLVSRTISNLPRHKNVDSFVY